MAKDVEEKWKEDATRKSKKKMKLLLLHVVFCYYISSSSCWLFMFDGPTLPASNRVVMRAPTHRKLWWEILFLTSRFAFLLLFSLFFFLFLEN